MMNLDDLIVRPHDTLRTALERMTSNRKGILFVCDSGAHPVGVVTDGDVRRSLLAGTLMIARVSSAMNVDPTTARTIQEAADLRRHLAHAAVPVVGPNGIMREVVIEEEEGEITVVRQAAAEAAPAAGGRFTPPIDAPNSRTRLFARRARRSPE